MTMLVPIERIRSTTDLLLGKLEQYVESPEVKDYFRKLSLVPDYDSDTVFRIINKRQDASIVMTRKEWRLFGRTVRKGANPIIVRVPKMVNGVMRMGSSSLYDISDTEGKPFPELSTRLLDQSLPGAEEIWDALVKTARCNVVVTKLDEEGMRGYYDAGEDKIVVNSKMPTAAKIKTLAHESAHSILHNRGSMYEFSQQEREVMAESVAFIVCGHFGIDATDYTLPYVAHWGGQDLKTIMNESFVREIRSTAAAIIDRASNLLYDTDFLLRANELTHRYLIMMSDFGSGEIPNADKVMRDFTDGRDIPEYIDRLRDLRMDLFANTLIDELQKLHERIDPVQNMTSRYLVFQQDFGDVMKRHFSKKQVQTYLLKGDVGIQTLINALPSKKPEHYTANAITRLNDLLIEDLESFQHRTKQQDKGVSNNEKNDRLQRRNDFYR